eukprot:m51a1_g10407 hypothetical protein (361) ;mRNA; r:19442-43515
MSLIATKIIKWSAKDQNKLFDEVSKIPDIDTVSITSFKMSSLWKHPVEAILSFIRLQEAQLESFVINWPNPHQTICSFRMHLGTFLGARNNSGHTLIEQWTKANYHTMFMEHSEWSCTNLTNLSFLYLSMGCQMTCLKYIFSNKGTDITTNSTLTDLIDHWEQHFTEPLSWKELTNKPFKSIIIKLKNYIMTCMAQQAKKTIKGKAETALEKQQMYVDHCLKIVQAFYNYIEKGLHYSNRAEFKTCIKEICKQSHSKKITSEQYKNTAGNVKEQFNSKKMNLQTFQESIKLRENLHKWLQENGMTKRLRADKDSDLDSLKEAEDEAWNPKVLSDEEKKRPHKKRQGESKTQISAVVLQLV